MDDLLKFVKMYVRDSHDIISKVAGATFSYDVTLITAFEIVLVRVAFKTLLTNRTRDRRKSRYYTLNLRNI